MALDERTSTRITMATGGPATSGCANFQVFRAAGTRRASVAVLVLAGLALAVSASAEIPPAVERKAVTLKPAHALAASAFAAECGKCHARPDPAGPAADRPGCVGRIPEAKRAQVRAYVGDVRAGKELYEARCGRCHPLIAPASRTAEHWSKNMCTSQECFVENLLEEQEQQVLLYLTSQARKE